ncbi:MAG TPA: queuosine salvage family protein [Candidatus Dormibacteraeota bacterium]
MASEARWVRVRREAIAAYANRIGEVAPPAQLDPEFHYHGATAADTATFVLTLGAINFGSGYFPHLRRRDQRSGYFHVARALKERFERGVPPAAELAALTVPQVAEIFGQPLEQPIAELMTLFGAALNAFGRHLLERWEGRAEVMVRAAGGSAERLAGLLAEVPFFDDVHSYRGRSVPIYKRAQIAPADLSLALEGQGLGRFDDLERLTIFADNLVPHVLRLDGVVEFDPVLEERIERGELLVSGAADEVEMRACAIHAVELLAGELRDQGRPRTAMALDHVLWNRGQGPDYKARPRPRCRSVYY